MTEENLNARCSRCEHKKEEHAMFIDNTTASASYEPQRRHCLALDCRCPKFVDATKAVETKATTPARMVGAERGSEPHVIRPMSTSEEVQESDNLALKESLRKALEHDKMAALIEAAPICEDCINSKYPGIVWPSNYHYREEEKAWITRCDECDLFKDDYSAAYFLSAVTGLPIELGKLDDGYSFFTPISPELVRSMARALRIG